GPHGDPPWWYVRGGRREPGRHAPLARPHAVPPAARPHRQLVRGRPPAHGPPHAPRPLHERPLPARRADQSAGSPRRAGPRVRPHAAGRGEAERRGLRVAARLRRCRGGGHHPGTAPGLLARLVKPEGPRIQVGADTPLGKDGLWLDSGQLLELVIACEVEFGVSVEAATDLTPDTLRTVGTLAMLIRSKRAG